MVFLSRKRERTFSRRERLLHSKDFERVFKEGRIKTGKLLVIRYLRNDLDVSRIGITVGKRHGNAVKRNRMKRLIREVYRLNKSRLKSNYDFVVSVKTIPEKPLCYWHVEQEVLSILAEIGVLK